MTKTSKDTAEAKRWLIVGAYQAGATEKHIARIAGLSRTAVRNIILNYKRTGKPCIPKKIPNKVRQKLVVEYDENGNLIDSDDDKDDDNEQETAGQAHLPQRPQQHISDSRSISKKQKKATKQPFKNGITPKDMISYTINQMRISASEAEQLTTAALSQPSIASPISLASPLPAKIPRPSKTDQDIRGYELWSHEDDMLLLKHVLHHLHGGGWADLEAKFEGRHSARLCYDRWKHLKGLLISGITDKPNTPW
ncbi:hypothetical protein [Parasitella parasitica]|uniref:Myb-like domain-containing protein n=1 Tax=Parasitella parasitica TaxID=35722 RepID=A0A0B7MYV2_9FUNG|nr:hypothetical protein [Parasitella parasitica]